MQGKDYHTTPLHPPPQPTSSAARLSVSRIPCYVSRVPCPLFGAWCPALCFVTCPASRVSHVRCPRVACPVSVFCVRIPCPYPVPRAPCRTSCTPRPRRSRALVLAGVCIILSILCGHCLWCFVPVRVCVCVFFSCVSSCLGFVCVCSFLYFLCAFFFVFPFVFCVLRFCFCVCVCVAVSVFLFLVFVFVVGFCVLVLCFLCLCRSCFLYFLF